MKIPLELHVRNLEKTRELESIVEAETHKLEKVCDAIIGCRVLIEQSSRRSQSAPLFKVQVYVTVPPNHQVIVRREPKKHVPYKALSVIIHDAFHATERQIRRVVQRRQPRQREKRKKLPLEKDVTTLS